MRKWILEGNAERDIAEAVESSWPGQDPAPLIRDAIGQIRAAGEFDADLVVGWCFEAYRELYRRMVDIGDFAGALRAVNQIASLAKSQPPPENPPAESP